MNIEKKIRIAVISITIVLCIIVAYTINKSVEFTLYSQEYSKNKQYTEDFTTTLLQNIIEVLHAHSLLSSEETTLKLLGNDIAKKYIPTATQKTIIEPYLKNCTTHAITASIYSSTGDFIQDLTTKTEEEKHLNPFTTTTFPELPHSFAKNFSYSTTIVNPKQKPYATMAYITPLISSDALLILTKSIDITTILTKEELQAIAQKTIPLYTQAQLLSEARLMQSAFITPTIATQLKAYFEQKERNYIDITSSTKYIYTISYIPFLQSYILITKNISATTAVLAQIRTISTTVIIIFTILSILVLPLYLRIILQPLVNLTKFVTKLASTTEPKTAVDMLEIQSALPMVKTPDEVGQIAQSFISLLQVFTTTQERDFQTTEKNKKFMSELEVAKHIQNAFFPNIKAYKKNPHFSCTSKILQELPLSGDFHDSCLLDEKTLYFTIGTVSNNSVAAAMFMALTIGLLRTLMTTTQDIATIMNTANDIIRERNQLGISISAIVGILDLETGTLRYINAGHPELIHLHNGTMRQDTTTTGFHAMGLWESLYYVEKTIELQEGDALIMYTKGLLERQNKDGKHFGLEQLTSVVLDNTQSTAEEIIYSIEQKLHIFGAGRKQEQDALFLCIQYKPDLIKEQQLFSTIVGTDVHLHNMKEGIIYN